MREERGKRKEEKMIVYQSIVDLVELVSTRRLGLQAFGSPARPAMIN